MSVLGSKEGAEEQGAVAFAWVWPGLMQDPRQCGSYTGYAFGNYWFPDSKGLEASPLGQFTHIDD